MTITQDVMKLIEYQTKYFDQDPVTTEFEAYRLLKEKPLDSDVNYLAVPWAYLINKNRLSSITLKRKKRRGFSVCQHAYYKTIIPVLLNLAIDTLFTPHVDMDHKELRVLPFPHVAVNGAPPSACKDVLYSFLGVDSTSAMGSDVRRKIFTMSHVSGAVVKERKQWHWNLQNSWGRMFLRTQLKEKNEYQDILSRSRFSLCPRGVGTSTIRFWESLKAGAIPVVISDRFRLPNSFDWSQCVVHVPEKRVLEFPEILNNISWDQEEQMKKACLEAYQQFSGDRLIHPIREAYHETL